MAKSSPALLQGLEQHLKSGGEMSMASLRANFEVGTKVLAVALSELARKGVIEAVNPNSKRKRYRLVGAQAPSEPKLGRPIGAVSEKQFLARLRTIRLALDPKGKDVFWRTLEENQKAYYGLPPKIRAALK